MRKLHMALAVGLLGLAACGGPGARSSTQMNPPSPGSSSAMPQSANSLPVGDTVNAPRAPATGNVTTRAY